MVTFNIVCVVAVWYVSEVRCPPQSQQHDGWSHCGAHHRAAQGPRARPAQNMHRHKHQVGAEIRWVSGASKLLDFKILSVTVWCLGLGYSVVLCDSNVFYIGPL